MSTPKSLNSEEMQSIWQRAVASVDDRLAESTTDSSTPPSLLIDRWVASHTNSAFPLRPVRRDPASAPEILEAEQRLGFELPHQVRELYGATNGLEWVRHTGSPMDFGGHFPPLSRLSLGKDLSPPLSSLLQREWDALGDMFTGLRLRLNRLPPWARGSGWVGSGH